MSKARHDRFSIGFGLIDEPRSQARHLTANTDDGLAQVQPNICCDLIVARSSRVQFFTSVADNFSESGLYIHVHVFELDTPFETAR